MAVVKHPFALTLVVAAITAAACGSVAGTPTSSEVPPVEEIDQLNNSAPDTPTAAPVASEPSLDLNLIQTELVTPPALIEGPFAVTDTLAYLDAEPRLAAAPYDEVAASLDVFGFIGRVWKPEVLVGLARLVIVADVVEIGAPRFNSDDGGFWTSAMITNLRPDVVPEALHVYREVKVDIVEVVGDSLETGLSPGDSVVFINWGGQVLVRPPAESGDGPPVTESFVYNDPPIVDFAVGDRLVFLLNWGKFSGLYGGQYAYVFRLGPVHISQYAYRLEGDQLINLDPVFDQDGDFRVPRLLDLTLAELRALIPEYLGSNAGPLPQPGVFPAEPHPPVEDSGEPYQPPSDEPPHDHGEGDG